jgi:hypothetical protein
MSSEALRILHRDDRDAGDVATSSSRCHRTGSCRNRTIRTQRHYLGAARKADAGADGRSWGRIRAASRSAAASLPAQHAVVPTSSRVRARADSRSAKTHSEDRPRQARRAGERQAHSSASGPR